MNYIDEYLEAIRSGKCIVGKRIRREYEKLSDDIHNPKDGFIFDEARAQRPIDFIERFCRHSKGEKAGTLIKLELFQKAFISALFGFIDKETGLRKYRETLFYALFFIFILPKTRGIQFRRVRKAAVGVSKSLKFQRFPAGGIFHGYLRSMKNQYYLKDKKAEIIQTKSEQDSPVGMFVTKYYLVTKSPIWCYTRQLSEDLVFQAKAYGNNESRLFVFNQGTTVNLYDLIRYRGKWYQVTRVDTTDDYNTDVFVYVQDCPLGEIPKDDEIITE